LSEASTTNQRKPGQTFIVNLHVISTLDLTAAAVIFFIKMSKIVSHWKQFYTASLREHIKMYL
jgi:hypothetical protein